MSKRDWKPVEGVVLDPAVAAVLNGGAEGEGAEEGGEARKRSPHEVNRVRRSMSVSFPDAGWLERLEALAARWGPGVEKADLVVLAVARLLEEVEGGLERPQVRERRPWMRTGEIWGF